MASRNAILRLENITKIFPGVKALDGVKLDISRGEVHALCGENGAGKSTLMKIISGAQEYTSGKMYFEDKEVAFSSTREAQDLGISMIYQEFNLVPYLTVAENLFIGRYPEKKNGFVDWKQLYEKADILLKKVGLKIDPKMLIKDISVAEAQMIEIAKCLSVNSKVIIMDEPTAALNDEEINYLFNIIEDLKKEGIAIIYISHRMEEIFKITDKITVFRDGKYISTMNTEDTDEDELVKLMVGKDIKDLYPKRHYEKSQKVLEIKNISYGKVVNNVSLELHRGEILGIAGLLGSGNVQLSKVISGYYKEFEGKVFLEGKEMNIKSPLDAINNGISLVPDDRKNEGLVLIRSIRENICLASMDSLINNRFINPQKEKVKVDRQVKQLNIKIASPEQMVGNLSGGNQQKVVFAKMLETKPKILLLTEPTRGVDVGAKAEIYQIMNELAQDGMSIILVSSDLPELIGMSDRVLVMKEGEVVKELKREELSQETVLLHAAGGANS